jgi:hypothetical protein
MLDNEIDNAAGRMTSGEPGGDLRARVLARLDEQPRAKRFGWMVIVAPLAALGLMVIALQIHEGRETPMAQPAPVVQHVEQLQPVQRAPAGQPVREIQRVQPRAPKAGESAATIADDAAATGIEPISVAPVVVDAIPQPDAIVIDDLGTAPIEIDELEIPILAQ